MTIINVHDHRIPDIDQCIPSRLLERWAVEKPQGLFALFESGEQWTWRDALEQVRSTAAGLRNLGINSGDYVGMWLPSGPDAVRVWFAINYLGAVCVPLNLAYRGRLLEHCIAVAGMRVLIAHAELAPRLAEIDTGPLSQLVVSGGQTPAVGALRVYGHDMLQAPADGLQAAPVAPWDTQLVIYTSGTTGPSKAVLMSYLQVYAGSEATYGYTGADDRFLVNLPLFHVSGVGAVIRSLVTGGSFAMVSAFRTQDFWDVVKRTRSTSVLLMGVMASFLMKQAPSARDRGHGLRSVMMVPLSEDAEAFSQRFGCAVHTVFNMSETSSPLRAGPNPGPLGTCGKPRAGVEVRLVDGNDCEVAVGSVGELIIRTDQPWAMSHGYLGDPEATAAAWRNGWFHSGDLFRTDRDGNFFFVDRLKDSIRRRGENVSSFEVEAEICAHPEVREAAVVAVPSELGEDEIMAVIVLVPQATLAAPDLLGFLVARLPHFMVPRYVRFLRDLPKTPTQKVQKHILREAGITPDTFDREAAGLTIRRERIGG